MTPRKPSECIWQCRDRRLDLGRRALVMGIVNVTPDSFSDGGRFADPERAIAHGLNLIRDGADIVDIGGESTRPGALPVSADEELSRILPVIRALRQQSDVLISADTMKATVAEQAVAAGAQIINDVSAMTGDPRMTPVAAASGAGVILMHMRGEPRTMQKHPQYENVVREVSDWLASRMEAAAAGGVPRECLAVDPGIGFGKTVEHNLQLLAHLDILLQHQRPVVIGLSRKSFLGRLTGREVDERLAAGLGAMAFCLALGAHVVRVHDVKESLDAATVVNALLSNRE